MIRTEGQPRQPFKRLLHQALERVIPHVPVDKERLRAYIEKLDRGDAEHKAWLLRQPKIPQREEFEGRMLTGIEIYTILRERHERRKREAREQWEPLYPVPLVPEKVPLEEIQSLPKNVLRQRNRFRADYQTRLTIKEVQDRGLGIVAQDIQRDNWNDTNKLKPVSTLKHTGTGKISIKKDGTVINSSQWGYQLSYPPERKQRAGNAQKAALFFGIGYFHERDTIIPEARGRVSNDDLFRGVKGYFVERTTLDSQTRKQKTATLVIPFTYDQARMTFYRRLLEAADDLAPTKGVSLRRGRRNPQPVQIAA